MSDRVEIFEVGPRDGLQNEKSPISVAEKVSLIDQLSDAGFHRVECASFVSPKWVPQMAGSADVLSQITRAPGVRYAALTPNMRGFDDAIAAKADEVAIFGSASEGFSQANINASIAESLDRFRPVVAAAADLGIPVRGYVSCVVDCPYDGPTPPSKVADVAQTLADLGCYEVSLGDTLGRATPHKISEMLQAVTALVPATILAGHYHDTDGHALDNIETSLGFGLRVFDAAVGGLGGCPYAPGAAGNVATEAVMDRLTSLGLDHGLNPDTIAKASRMAQEMRA